MEDSRGDGAKEGIDGGIINSGNELVSKAAENVAGPCGGTHEPDEGLETLADDLDIDLGGKEVGVNEWLGEDTGRIDLDGSTYG